MISALGPRAGRLFVSRLDRSSPNLLGDNCIVQTEEAVLHGLFIIPYYIIIIYDQLHFCSAGLPRTAVKQLVCSMWHLGIAMQGYK